MNNHTPIANLHDTRGFRLDDSGKSKAYFSIRKPCIIDSMSITQLKEIWNNDPDRNVRICLHDSPQSSFHEMVILESPKRYYRPHKHITKGESYHLIEGRLGVFIFSDQGVILDSRILDTNDSLIYRIAESVFHCILPISNPVIYHECKLGPFTGKEDSIWADWSPSESETDEVFKFQEKLRKHLLVN